MSKFDTCIYADYMAEYSQRICNHPRIKGTKKEYDAPCRGCKFHETAKSGLEKCPFCKGTAYCGEANDGHYPSNWEVRCQKCGANIKRGSIAEAKEAWNKRIY